MRNLIHLEVLWAFAVVQPTLSSLSENADLFVTRQVESWSFLTVIVAFAFLPPLLLVGIEALARLISERALEWVHLFFAWGLLALLALFVLKRLLPAQGAVLIPAAWVIGLAATYLYARAGSVATFFAVLAPASLVFLGYFLFLSPSHKLIFPEPAHAAAARPSRTPVVMVVFDELPVGSLMNEYGRIDAELFPNFAALARQATWYRSTTAAADQTEEAVPAVLDGRRPRAGTLPILHDHPHNIFTLMANSHTVHGMEHITWLCPPSLCPNQVSTPRRMFNLASALSLVYAHVVAPAPIEARLAEVGSTWQEAQAAKDPAYQANPRTAPRAELARHPDAQLEHFLQLIQPAGPDRGRAPLYLLHSSLPHVPWKFAPSGRLYTGNFRGEPGLLDGGQVWGPDRVLVDGGLQRHLAQVQFCDLLLGRLLRQLREKGLLQRSMVVVTADHGASFMPRHNRRPVDRGDAGEVGLVPFFMKAPGQRRGRISDEHLQTIDVLPTMADVLGVRIPWHVDGQAAAKLPPAGRRTVSIFARFGKAVTLPPAVLERQRRRSIRRKLALFGSGAGPRGIYAIGADRDLLGRPVLSLHAVAGKGSVQLDSADDLRHVDTSSHFVPTLVEGSVPRGVQRVVVAVNGQVRAAAPTYSDGGGTHFALLIPESSLHGGSNHVEVMAASGSGSGRRLSLLRAGQG